ncbi:PerC family transcriptional regulator [Pseudescherichia vulneris]|uniref:PerC family transcriptional regulator n=1 Tax=Pseudescherichia vulneris TaxID=566 RepID=UPI00227A7A2B|nr:PerC family transcriptional regulator [Pseudescherichia vulneris]WAH53338.1 PerC family transcriptional regulator [Pseudescherichia vulneris]
MSDIESSTVTEAMLLNDGIAEALERAGLWRRAATRWLHIFDRVETDRARERIALRREACLRMASSAAGNEGSQKCHKRHRMLLATK